MPKVRHTIRVDEADLETWKQAAEKTGYSLSEWIRRQCNLEFFKQAMENTAKHFGLEVASGDANNSDRVPRSEQSRALRVDKKPASVKAEAACPKCGLMFCKHRL